MILASESRNDAVSDISCEIEAMRNQEKIFHFASELKREITMRSRAPNRISVKGKNCRSQRA